MHWTKMMPALALCAILGACASTGPRSAGVATKARPDDGKVASVEGWARGRGATVVWINYPMRAPDHAGRH